MRIAPSLALIFLSILVTTPAYTLTTEESFKSIAQKIAALDQKAIKSGKVSADWNEKSQAFRKSLKALIKADPASEWADDAQYLVGVLSEAERLDVPEKEGFLKSYPEGRAEPWTQEQLAYIVPSKLSLDLSVRMDLCMAYLKRGERSRLKKLAEESSAKYPDRAIFFSTLVKRSETTA